MPRVNQNQNSGPSSVNYFRGSPYHQYRRGFGAAIKAGLKGFVIPMVKRYGIPVAKSFLQQAAPEVINILDSSTKKKAAMRNAVKKTIRKQVGGGRGGRIQAVSRYVDQTQQRPLRERERCQRRIATKKTRHRLNQVKKFSSVNRLANHANRDQQRRKEVGKFSSLP